MTIAPAQQMLTRGARYYAPLVVLAAIALAPFALVMLRTPPPADFAAGKALLRTVWMLVPLVWLGQVALVGGVASLVARAPSQLRAIPIGLEGLARAYLAAILAFVTVGIGALALGVPGLVLLVLLAPIGAFAWNTPAGPALITCLTQARARWRRIALTTFAVLLVDVAIVYLAQRFGFPLANAKAKPPELAAFVPFARLVTAALVVVSPALALALSAAVGDRPENSR